MLKVIPVEKYMDKINVNIKKDLRIGIGVLLDHHVLGKQIVYSILRISGYDVLDFGQGLSVDVDQEDFGRCSSLISVGDEIKWCSVSLSKSIR